MKSPAGCLGLWREEKLKQANILKSWGKKIGATYLIVLHCKYYKELRKKSATLPLPLCHHTTRLLCHNVTTLFCHCAMAKIEIDCDQASTIDLKFPWQKHKPLLPPSTWCRSLWLWGLSGILSFADLNFKDFNAVWCLMLKDSIRRKKIKKRIIFLKTFLLEDGQKEEEIYILQRNFWEFL